MNIIKNWNNLKNFFFVQSSISLILVLIFLFITFLVNLLPKGDSQVGAMYGLIPIVLIVGVGYIAFTLFIIGASIYYSAKNKVFNIFPKHIISKNIISWLFLIGLVLFLFVNFGATTLGSVFNNPSFCSLSSKSNLCIREVAFRTENIDLCSDDPFCILDLAVKTMNTDWCEKLPTDLNRFERCHTEIAILKKDVSLCKDDFCKETLPKVNLKSCTLMLGKNADKCKQVY